MTSYPLPTNLALSHDGNTDSAIIDYFRTTLADISAPVSASSFELDPLTNSATAFSDVIAGTNKFSFNDDVFSGNAFSRVFSYMPFGFGPTELMAWWFHGGGAALHRSITDAQGAAGDYILLPVDLQHGETGGWYRESITLKKLHDGQYADGSPIKLRLYQESAAAMVRAFPDVTTPAATPGISFLNDVFNGTYTGGESNSIRGDASLLNGLFPNFPGVTGSIIAAGCKHFYMAAPWTPGRIRWCVVNKPFWVGLTTSQQAQLSAAAEAAALRNVAYSFHGQDALVKTMQDLGAVVHEQFPTDVLRALRDAVNQIHDERAAADAEYQQVLDSIRAYARDNQVRWRANVVDNRLRFADRPLYQPELAVDRLR